MNKVILKHYKKEQKMRKNNKDAKELAMFNQEKKIEAQTNFDTKLKNLKQNEDERGKQLSKKFNQLDRRQKDLKDSINNYSSAIKESNMFRQLDHNEQLQKVRRAQSAYKRHLAAKIMDKANRGRDISERQKKLSELASTTSQQIGL